jgi:excisionase family DNA binding protein
LRARANISRIKRPRLFSVAEAAAELKASEAYVRRLLLRERLFGTKIGSVWAIYPDDLEAFSRTRRPPGRPRKLEQQSRAERASAFHIAGERSNAGTGPLLRKRLQMPGGPKRTGRPSARRKKA